MQAVYQLVPVIADVIAAHCPRSSARARFIDACLKAQWNEATAMIEGMLSEPRLLRGHQEARLRDFLELLPLARRSGTGAA